MRRILFFLLFFLLTASASFGQGIVDARNYGVVADWKEFWASNTPTISVTNTSMTIKCTKCFTPADQGKEIVGSSNCNGDVSCGMAGLPLFANGTTITAVTDWSTAQVNPAAINSGSTNAYIAFGTNDEVAWTAVSSAIQSMNTCVTVIFPAGMSNWDNVGKFNTAPASCTATNVTAGTGAQTNTALSLNSAMTYMGYGPATSRIMLTPAFASSMHSPGCSKACAFGTANTIVKDIGFWGGGNSVACYSASTCSAGAAPCTTTTYGPGSSAGYCTILGAMSGSYYQDVSSAGFGGGANATNTMIGIGGPLIDGGGVFASYNNVKEDGFGNIGVTGQTSTSNSGQYLDNFKGNFVCNGLCYTWGIGYGNGYTIQPAVGALYNCAVTPCFSQGDYLAYAINGTAYQIFELTASGNLHITGFDTTHSYAGSPPSNANWFYCNGAGCLVHIKNSQVAVGSSGNAFASFGLNTGDVFYDEGGNNITGAISWQGTVAADGRSVKGTASGTCIASATLGMYGTGPNATATSCASSTIGTGIVVSGGPRTLYVLQVSAGTAGVSGDSVKVLQNTNPVGTCVIGTSKSCSIALSVTLNDGDLMSLEVVTGAATTLANVQALAAWY